MIGAVIVLFCGGCLALLGLGLAEQSEQQGSTSAQRLADERGEELGLPPEQREFLDIVGEAQAAAEDANEFAVVRLREERGDKLCDLLDNKLTVSGWIGEIEEAHTELGGDSGVLSIRVADGVSVKTWNNVVSDFGDKTLNSEDSGLWDTLASLSEGERVRFNGTFVRDDDHCVRESSLMDANGIKTPDFVFRFTELESIDE